MSAPARIALRLMSGVLLATAMLLPPGQASAEIEGQFRRIGTQYIAALGDPNSNSGDGAQSWGLWRLDPGPRGVWLSRYDELQARGGYAPAKWQFDGADWWLEENGLIMEKPNFPVSPGRYIVTGNREVITVLTIHPADQDGNSRWELDNGATLHDVTHLACRSARYTPAAGNGSCSPAKVQGTAFPVAPGAAMPTVEGCNKQDYAVLFVIGVAVDN